MTLNWIIVTPLIFTVYCWSDACHVWLFRVFRVMPNVWAQTGSLDSHVTNVTCWISQMSRCGHVCNVHSPFSSIPLPIKTTVSSNEVKVVTWRAPMCYLVLFVHRLMFLFGGRVVVNVHSLLSLFWGVVLVMCTRLYKSISITCDKVIVLWPMSDHTDCEVPLE